MSVTAASLRQSGSYQLRNNSVSAVLRPKNVRELLACLSDTAPYSAPFRPVGAGSSSTDCNTASSGTLIDLTALDEVVHIDAYNDSVVVQAGIRIGVLANRLARQGLELAGSYELMDRTIGGAIASGCIGAGIANDGAFLASHVVAMSVVTPSGQVAKISDRNKQMLNAYRLSYGMLGIIYEVTLKVRPIATFEATHKRCTIKQFSAATESLARSRIGIKFYLMPFRDRVYLDLRRYNAESTTRKLPWKFKEWGESTVLPHVFKSIGRIVPVAGARYRIIDEISKATQQIVNNRLVRSGSSIASSSLRKSNPYQYTTWLFPAADFAIVAQTYTEFCREIHKKTGFRCDMPTVGFGLAADQSAWLSPSFDEPMFALRAVSTQKEGWENFVLDFAEFAEHWGGSPFYNQTRGLTPDHSNAVFGERLQMFRRVRRQLDPDNRFMNPFLSQYFL